MIVSSDRVNSVRERADIVGIVGRYVDLRERGQGYIGPCPFHDEDAPSLHVVPGKGFFHCFGCQASGDVFSFLQLAEEVTFAEAVEIADQGCDQ